MGWPVWFAAAANRNFQVAMRTEKAEGGAFRSRRGAKRRKAELSGRDAERKGGRRSFQVVTRSKNAGGEAKKRNSEQFFWPFCSLVPFRQVWAEWTGPN